MSHGTVGAPNRFHMGSKSKPVMTGCAAPGTRWSGDKELRRPRGVIFSCVLLFLHMILPIADGLLAFVYLSHQKENQPVLEPALSERKLPREEERRISILQNRGVVRPNMAEPLVEPSTS